MMLIDLTHPVVPGMAVYPGDPEVRFVQHAALQEVGYRLGCVQLGTHTGTHLDAPAHFLSGGAGVETLPVGVLVGTARVVDLGDEAAVLAACRPGARILLRCGWSARWGTPGYYRDFPALPRRVALAMAEAPVALVGLEAPSLHPVPEEDAYLHRLLLERGIVIVENLAGMELLPPEVWVAALPLPLVGADGAPCRVIALEAAPLVRKD
jgi:arylformamidase